MVDIGLPIQGCEGKEISLRYLGLKFPEDLYLEENCVYYSWKISLSVVGCKERERSNTTLVQIDNSQG